jgi:pimeloyl-ACP methyl ester carboxylesterase
MNGEILVNSHGSVVSQGQGSLGQENAAGSSGFSWRTLMRMSFIAVAAGVALGGALAPAGFAENDPAKTKLGEIMERHDRLVQLSDPNCRRPPLFLIHGATDDPTEMMAIVREWKNEYNVFLYSYNYHKRVEKVAADFVNELRRLKEKGLAGNATVIAFSYGAIVFREAVILAPDSTLFAGDRLIQIAPTAGGSFFARGMENPLASFVISMASKPSAAANPYGTFAQHVWEGKGNEKFCSVIDSKRMLTIVVDGDPNSVSRIQDEKIQRRYKNGIGQNVIIVPKSAGISHAYFVVEPAGLECLRKVMESSNMQGNASNKARVDLYSKETLSLLGE